MGVKIRKKDGEWYVFVNHQGLRKAKCVGVSKAAAVKVKQVLDAKLALGDFGFLANNVDTPTFELYAAGWLETYAALECKRSTRHSYEQLLRVHVTPRFGKKRINQITRDSIKQYLGELSRETRVVDQKTGETVLRFSRNTLRLIVCALRTVLNSAVEDGLIETNPAAKVGRFAKTGRPAHQASAMTRNEAEQFLNAVQEVCPEWYPFFSLHSGRVCVKAS